jgi:hypothetical protein
MEENNLDKYFQEQLAGHTEEPPPAVWEGIASQTPAGGFVWNKRYLLLLLLFISIGGAAFLGYRLYEMDSRVAELEEKIKTESRESVSETAKGSTEIADQNSLGISETNEGDAVISSADKNQESDPILSESLQGEDFVETSNSARLDNLASTSESPSTAIKSDSKKGKDAKVGLSLTPNLKSAFGKTETRPKANSSSPSEKPEARSNYQGNFTAGPSVPNGNSSLAFNPILLSSITPYSMVNPEFMGTKRDVDYFNEPRKDWFLFVYGMANYTHRRIVVQAEGSEAIPNQLDQAENGLITPGAGLQLSRELSPSLRLNIGVEYNQWIHEGSYGIEVQFEDVSIETNTLTELAEFNFGGNIESSFGSNSYNSSTAENPLGEDFATASPNLEPLAIQLETRRRISYLAIPITLEYVFNAYPFRFTAGGGISVNHIIRSDFSFEVEPDAPGFEVGEVEAVEGTYLAFQAGFGVEYGISERMSLRLNPSYRGWMTPIFENEEIRTLPFGVAIIGGVVYRLGK